MWIYRARQADKRTIFMWPWWWRHANKNNEWNQRYKQTRHCYKQTSLSAGKTGRSKYGTDMRGRADWCGDDENKHLQILWIQPPTKEMSSIWHDVWGMQLGEPFQHSVQSPKTKIVQKRRAEQWTNQSGEE